MSVCFLMNRTEDDTLLNTGIRGMTMNLLEEKKIIHMMSYNNNFAYVIENKGDFVQTEYKVMSAQGEDGFIQCMQTLYNGKIQLYYLVEDNKKLSVMLRSNDDNRIRMLVANLLSAILSVRNNGFLKCENIDIEFDRIFVDQNTLKISLVYLPLSVSQFDSASAFENELRSRLVKAIDSLPYVSTAMNKLQGILTDGTLSLEDVHARLKGGPIDTSAPSHRYTAAAQHQSAAPKCALLSLNAPSHVTITINKPEFILGKSPDKTDYAITFNKAISRVHCKIVATPSGYAVVDLGSANGTYLNGKRLSAQMQVTLQSGDTLRLANTDFKVVV